MNGASFEPDAIKKLMNDVSFEENAAQGAKDLPSFTSGELGSGGLHQGQFNGEGPSAVSSRAKTHADTERMMPSIQ